MHVGPYALKLGCRRVAQETTVSQLDELLGISAGESLPHCSAMKLEKRARRRGNACKEGKCVL